ncbi:MAG: hypothetical protein DLM62_18210, partial [Pseudonocardiales bacterium]
MRRLRFGAVADDFARTPAAPGPARRRAPGVLAAVSAWLAVAALAVAARLAVSAGLAALLPVSSRLPVSRLAVPRLARPAWLVATGRRGLAERGGRLAVTRLAVSGLPVSRL